MKVRPLAPAEEEVVKQADDALSALAAAVQRSADLARLLLHTPSLHPPDRKADR